MFSSVYKSVNFIVLIELIYMASNEMGWPPKTEIHFKKILFANGFPLKTVIKEN
jgi:hypothetical protein